MSFAELVHEFESEIIGERILSLVESVVDSVLRSSSRFQRESRDDVLQGFVTDSLIAGGQLAYAFGVSRDVGHVRALFVKQLRRYLAAKRTKTVVDNLLERCRVRAVAPPFVYFDRVGDWAYSIVGKELAVDVAASEKLRDLAGSISPSYRLTDSGDRERAPILLSDIDLEQVMAKAAGLLDCAVSSVELREMFRLGFTPFIPSVLYQGDMASSLNGVMSTENAPDHGVLVRGLAANILGDLEMSDRRLLLLKLNEVSDEIVAREVGVSRPTLSKRKHALFQRLRGHLEVVSDSLQEAVVEAVHEELRKQDEN